MEQDNSKEVRETRFQPTSSPKIETREDGVELIIGQGVVFEQRSEKLGGFFYETVKRDSFKEADTSDVVALFNHNNDYVLGRSSSGTMRFDIDIDGVRYEIDAPQTQTIRDLVIAPMKRGDIRGSSFQFSIFEEDGDSWEYDKVNQVYHRNILRVQKLYDLSPVTMPAYSQSTSSVTKRSFESFKKELNNLQKKEESHIKRSMAAARVRIYAVS